MRAAGRQTQVMAISKSERARNAVRSVRLATQRRADAFTDVAGVLGGSYVSGRFTSGKDAGPLTINQWAGLAGTFLKIWGPMRRNPIINGATTAAVTMGGTDVFALGLKHRLEAAQKAAQNNDG